MKLLHINWLVLLSSLLIAVNISAATEPLSWDKQVQRGTLDNGLNYYFYNSGNKDEPFNLRLIVHAGSIDEPKVKGIAHAVEHMVFNQSKAHPETVLNYLTKIGWQTGRQVNAKTQPSETYFMIRTRPHDALDLQGSLQLLSDIAGGAQFNAQQWKLEKQIITEEKRLGDSVVERLSQQIKYSTKANSKYSQGSVIGTYQSIQSITLDDLKQFYKKNYVASNMSLIVSGYFDNKQLKQLVKETLGQLPAHPKPQREYLNFPLDNNIKMNSVQDRQGSSSKVALGLRMAVPSKSSVEGIRLRLNNYLIRKVLSDQVRADGSELTESIESLSAILKYPANERLTLAFAARTTDHEAGLKAILHEIERLKRYGLSEEALQARLTHARTVAKRNISAAKNRDFTNWEDKINEAVVTDGILSSAEDRLVLINQVLDEVTLESINQQLNKMLSATDTFIYYQAPASVLLTLPTEQQVKNWQAALRLADISKPVKQEATKTVKVADNTHSVIAMPTLIRPNTSTRLAESKQYPHQAIQEWQLDNGNRVVWLNRATSKGDIYLKAISAIGFRNQQQPEWLAQSAVQIFAQSAPNNVNQAQWEQWQKEQGAEWKFKLQKHHLDLSIITKAEQLDDTFHAFWLNHQKRHFSEDSIDAVQASLQAQQKKLKGSHFSEFLYDTKNDNEQDLKRLQAVTIDSLSEEANKLINQPHTLFIVGELEQQKLQKLITTYLTHLVDEQPLTGRLQLQQPGNHQFNQQHDGHIQQKTNLYGRTAMLWSPEDAFMLSTLNPVVQKALKQRLRRELAGVYTVRFEMNLEPDSDQLELQLSFVSAPERAEALALEAQKVLNNIPAAIKKMNIKQVRESIRFAEQSRLSQPTTWLRRLMLSYRKYDDPRYLDSMQTLSDDITQQRLLKLANKALPTQHQVQINTLYQPKL